MKLSKRLKTIADMVDNNYSVIDVGCDHAFLDIYLTMHGIECMAIDNKESVLKYSKKNIAEYGLSDKIKLLHNEGLESIKINSNDLIILAGLGTNTILNIIKNKNIEQMIVQSNDDTYNLRSSLLKQGYKITEEKVVYEKKYYTIIKFVRGKAKYNQTQLKYGPLLLKEKSKEFVNYLESRKKYLNNLLSSIPNRFIFKKLSVLIEIHRIKAILR